MTSKIVITATAVVLLLLGVGLSFLPQEAAAALGMGAAPTTTSLFQVLAAAFLGMGFLNWFSKQNRMGGIYSRPLALQNFLLFGVSGIALDRAAVHGPVPHGIQAAAVTSTVFAIAYAWLLFFHDPVAVAQKQQPLP